LFLIIQQVSVFFLINTFNDKNLLTYPMRIFRRVVISCYIHTLEYPAKLHVAFSPSEIFALYTLFL